jgi:hypothetical protein
VASVTVDSRWASLRLITSGLVVEQAASEATARASRTRFIGIPPAGWNALSAARFTADA